MYLVNKTNNKNKKKTIQLMIPKTKNHDDSQNHKQNKLDFQSQKKKGRTPSKNASVSEGNFDQF